MQLVKTELNGLFIIENLILSDNRGAFIKTMNFDFFNGNDLEVDFKEYYFSISNKNVIRGMHFQVPPSDHAKLVYVIKGAIIDVVLDIRTESKTFGSFFSTELNDINRKSIYISKGFAHGFLSLTDETIVMYHQTSGYNKFCDMGILYNSFGMNWDVLGPIVSERDQQFPILQDFNSPFK